MCYQKREDLIFSHRFFNYHKHLSMYLKLILSLAVAFIVIACAESGPKADGSMVFKTHCQLCHGPDGKLGLNGAKDLSASPLTVDERVQVITKGRNTMLAYESMLSEDEIKAVAIYTSNLK